MKYVILGFLIFLSLLTVLSAETPTRASKSIEPVTNDRPSFPDTAKTPPAVLLVSQPPAITQVNRSDSAEPITWILWRLLTPILLGGVGAAAINIYWSYRTRKREFVGLIIVLCAEFVTALNRCVTYYGQSRRGEISYSSLFVLSDASVLSRFATLVGKADLVIAAMNLKSHFFQIERHAETASRCIMEANAAQDMSQEVSLRSRAFAEQGAAVAFFLSPYDEIIRDLRLLLDVSGRLAKGSVAENLQGKFQSAIEKKATIDASAQAKGPTDSSSKGKAA